jgi:hypothetical protein
MCKLIRGVLLATLLGALPRCGGTSPGTTEEPAPSAGESEGGADAGNAGSKAGGSSGAGGATQAGSASGGAAGAALVGGAGGAAGAGAAGAAGAVSGIGCGATCGPNEYCRAPCSGTGFGFGGTAGWPMSPPLPSCYPLPAACNGTPTCDCICGAGTTFWCSTGSKPITSGPAIQCGCG